MRNCSPSRPADASISRQLGGDYCEREVDEVEWQGGRVYLHLGARREKCTESLRATTPAVTLPVATSNAAINDAVP
jgi:hypothetical protein